MLHRVIATALPALVVLAAPLDQAEAVGGYKLIGWNNLGMHCMDADYSVLSLLPPYNTIHAQLIDGAGNLVRDTGSITVTYEAVADLAGSRNSTSIGKTNFWQHCDDLFGVTLTEDIGLAGTAMPGVANLPQPMTFDAASASFVAEGVPITPYDDTGAKNSYPMLRLVAHGPNDVVLATTDVVVPVSDEMTCIACHASGSSAQAEPAGGWQYDADTERDFRLNILRIHDDRSSGSALFADALAAAGYNPAGLHATASIDGRSILCATCHPSEALPGSGMAGVSPLTQSIHLSMASATDPRTGLALDAADNRSACYACHPGTRTKCLRGTMGAAVAADGSMAMQCQSCHGRMVDVGAPTRVGWLNEPRCDSCHTGTAAHNNGQIRYLSVFESDGTVRRAVDATFATNDDAPAPGLSLYRFSFGHGDLGCSSCHGSTHAEVPSSHDNDNAQSIRWQGHKGVLGECNACHLAVPATVTGGPHGMHPVGTSWLERHGDVAEHGAGACRACHGMDYRGTMLSRAFGDRTWSTDYGTRRFFRGARIGCYACHAGPASEAANPNHAPVVQDAFAATAANLPVSIALSAADADHDVLALRIISQPPHGTVGISGTQARYYPDGTYSGDEIFTFAAWDGSIESNLGVVHVNVDACPPECVTPDGCDPACTPAEPHDAMVASQQPLSPVIGASAQERLETVTVTVANKDTAGAWPQLIRLDVGDGDCPAGTVRTTADFGDAAAGDAATVELQPGDSARARVRLAFAASAYSTPGRRAPQRCAVTLQATAVGAVDPLASNDAAPLEISVSDRNDAAATTDIDVFIDSVRPVSLAIARGAANAVRKLKLRITADGPAGSLLMVQGSVSDGTCPPGTFASLDLDRKADGIQSTAMLRTGSRLRATATITANAAAFGSRTSPERCTGIATVSSDAAAGDASNDTVRVVLDVTDSNDD